MQLSERRKKILCMAVEEYIKDCAPITSGGIKDVTDLGCSTATLRSELNTLEAMGYLRQLHTSGGRVPTPQGYRYYVENLLQGVEATDNELDEVKDLISSKTKSLTDIISGIAKIVSKATNYPTVVMLDSIEDLILQDIKIIPLLEEKIMVLIGTSAGYITDTIDLHADGSDCQDASNYLTKNFKGETIGFMIENIDQFKSGMHGEIKAFQKIVDTLVGGLKKINHQKLLDVRREGSAKLLENNGNIEEAKKVLSILDDEEKLQDALKIENKQGNIEVDVGEGEQVSVVRAPICVQGKQLASIGVIGPQRMDYAGIASALKVVVDGLKNIKGD